MLPSASSGMRSAPPIAAFGAALAVITIYAGPRPGPLVSSLHGTGVAAVIVFVALTAGGLWTLRTSSASGWRWATGIGVVLATAQLAGLAFRGYTGMLEPANLLWVAVHWLGTAWMAVAGMAALIGVLDAFGTRSAGDGAGRADVRSGPFGRLLDGLRQGRRRSWLTVFTVLVASRIPYLLVYWPGLVFFDTFRSYYYGRGLGQWETYEPVGASALFVTFQWLGMTSGLGDMGTVAIGSITLILASSGAFALMFTRMAVWGVPSRVWWATFAAVLLVPVFGYYSMITVKDVPFSIALVVFLVCVGEIAFAGGLRERRWWPWVGMTVAGAAALVTRNNGIHVMALTLPLLLLILRHEWKRLLVVIGVLVAVFAVYTGPVYSALNVKPGPKEETYSVPIQQLGRIAKYHSDTLSPADRAYLVRMFAGTPPEELGSHYVPGLSDPTKLTARKAWKDHTTGEFLAGWARIAAEYPGTAIMATLAGTAGYWDPEGPSYDGITRWSANDARGIHMDMPSGPPTAGAAAAIEKVMPTRTYSSGVRDDGYRAIPILGLAMSPGPMCWIWLISALLVIRRRSWRTLAVFAPIAVLLLSFLAGPVSGGQRYALTLFMAVPVAVAAVVLTARSRPPAAARSTARPAVARRERGVAPRAEPADDALAPAGAAALAAHRGAHPAGQREAAGRGLPEDDRPRDEARPEAQSVSAT